MAVASKESRISATYISFLDEASTHTSQSEVCLFFCDSAGGGINIKHVRNALTSSYCGKIRENALTAGIRRVSGSFSETESRCLDSSVTLIPRSLTF